MIGNSLFTKGSGVGGQAKARVGFAMIVGLSLVFAVAIASNLLQTSRQIVYLYRSLLTP